MKNLVYFLFSLVFILAACDDDIKDDWDGLFGVTLQLNYPTDYSTAQGVNVFLTNTASGSEYEGATDANGIATFRVEAGVYKASVTEKRKTEEQNKYVILSGSSVDVTITDNWNESTAISISLSESTYSQIVIKEVYTGGCVANDGTTVFNKDKYIILYNNSDVDFDLKDYCIAMSHPANGEATNHDNLFFGEEEWLPASTGVWSFTSQTILKPYSQIVVALHYAIDNTQTYSQSINFANPDYYCTYDIDVYPNATYYTQPADAIPTSHYLKAHHYAAGNAWTLSNTSPGVFIFKPEGMTPAEFVADAYYTNQYNNSSTAANTRKRVMFEWVLDGVELWLATRTTDSTKRIPHAIDNGYVAHIHQMGYSVYRNVDEEATLAIKGNADKLVYNYSLGTEHLDDGGSTDPSEIDAEASIDNGAIIIYQDTNNSTLDFHLRSKASLRN